MVKFKLGEDIVACAIMRKGWGNNKVADKGKIETKMDKKMLSARKRLIDSQEYKLVTSHLRETKQALLLRAVPSFFKKGIFLFKMENVEKIEQYVKQREAELKLLVEEFLKIYPAQIESAKELLGDQFKNTDYPTIEYLRNAFGIYVQWIAFDIPKGLPENIRKEAEVKMKKAWDDAAMEITMALRESFKGLIDHVLERLTSGKDEKKIFRNSMVENINEFIEAFKDKNITNDKELEELIAKAKKVINGVDAEDLRDNRFVRLAVKKGFTEIEKKLDEIIVETPIRKFKFGANKE